MKRTAVKNICAYLKKDGELYLMLLPCLTVLFVFSYIPYYGLTLAFKNYKTLSGVMGSPWCGLDNFKKLFGDPYFVKVLLNTVKISVLNLIIGYPLPILLVILMNEMYSNRIKKVFQVILYLPYFISWIVLAGIVKSLFNAEDGNINMLIAKIFGKPIPFYSNGKWFIGLIIFSNVWKGAGWGTVIYLAAVTSISPDLYEAATIDGAGRMKRIIHITLPGLRPAIAITLILSLAGLMQGNFDQIWNMYNKLLYDDADIIQTYIFRVGIGNGRQYGVTTALGLFESLTGLILILIGNFTSKKITGEGIW